MIFCDLDGVLADFDAGFLSRFGIPVDYVTKKEKWEWIRGCGDFFLYLPWTPFGHEIWKLIGPTGAHVLSTAKVSHGPDFAPHKVQWSRRELDIGTDRIIIVRDKLDKQLYCMPGDILLDDRAEVIEQWRMAGGYGMLITPDTAIDAAMTAVQLWRTEFKA